MHVLNLAAWLVLAGGLLTPDAAFAQRPMCVTPQAQCPTNKRPVGAPCQCPASLGTVITDDSDGPGYTDPPVDRPRRPVLRNDDLDDTDDVLAGPRHHRRDNN